MKQKKSILFYGLILLLGLSVMGCSQTDELLVKTYVDAGQEEAESLAKSSGLDQMFEIQLLARGSAVVYSYRYRNEQDQQDSGFSADDWDRALESQAPTYQSIVAGLKTSGIQKPSVIVEIIDAQGNIITSKEYK
ncbi:MAG: DUF4854 domain-containing protein [Peptococcaceae bacterium]|nr:DUF4854 domain-containing protein [Peptococcaceae bacterium]